MMRRSFFADARAIGENLRPAKTSTHIGYVVVDVSILWAVGLLALFVLKCSVVFPELLAVL